jgi:uncharacterized protein (DUF885 family)
VDGVITARELADRHVTDLAGASTEVATALGTHPGDDRVPDLSPDGQAALDDLARSTLAALPGAHAVDADDRRCARLLRERLTAGLAVSGSGEHLRVARNILGPHQRVRQLFVLMPTATADDWATVARRMARVPQAFDGWHAALREGGRRGLHAAPRQLATVVEQLDEWLAEDVVTASGRARARGGHDHALSWWHAFVADGPAALAADLRRSADLAAEATAVLRARIAGEHLPAAAGTPDAVGPERYRLGARLATGADLDLDETFAWGWDEWRRLDAELRAEAHRVLPGATPLAAMAHLDADGPAVEGVDVVREWLQELMDATVEGLAGHFTIEGPVRRVEAMIAPAGSAAAPYYTRPSLDFARPGRTWLPTLGETRFPVWSLVSTWYHEGVPGHHLQLARWVQLAGRLSVYQSAVGSVSATTEGWALYAERLMDELGGLTLPGARLGYLDAQQMRAVRVVLDIGMHLGLRLPADSPQHAGEVLTPEVARSFFGAQCGRPAAFLDSEIVRYLGWPGQAISYKLGERAWLAGRAAARAARGAEFDLAAWHAAALSLGALGLDDLTDELARL